MGHSPLILRPYGIVVSGKLELGCEVEVDSGRIVSVRPSTSPADDYVLSAAFVNAHSHLEYRGFQGRIGDLDYWPWIRKLTQLKRDQDLEQVSKDCQLAARENRTTGVARMAEHTDRVGSAAALTGAHLAGALYQELITVFEPAGYSSRKSSVNELVMKNSGHFNGPVHLAPHALFTVDSDSLGEIGRLGAPYSIHVAESAYEREWLNSNSGPIADMYKEFGLNRSISGRSSVAVLDTLGACRLGAQFVHCCDVDDRDIEIMARGGVAVAHCPRSNTQLGCKSAPVRRMIEAGIQVGIGLDSAASSGPIDMFAEMRAAWRSSHELGEPLTKETAWQLATNQGFESLKSAFGEGQIRWDIEVGGEPELIRIHVPGARNTAELLELASPDRVDWVEDLP